MSEEHIYKIIRIDEEDFGCEGRPEGQPPMVRVVLESDAGETMVVMMEDAVMYARKLDVGEMTVLGMDGMLYQPGTAMAISETEVLPVNIEKQAEWMESYWDALEELEDQWQNQRIRN